MRLFCLSIIFALLITGVAADVCAKLSGEINYSYGRYNLSVDGSGDFAARHFTQRYSVLYEGAGPVYNARLGYYRWSLGAEWASFASNLSGDGFESFDLDGNRFKPLYAGELVLAPGGLPFRLRAYSYDLAKIGFLNGIARKLPLGFKPEVASDIYDGQTIVSGITFMAGIRNGSYLGQYREILSSLPRLLVDYRDVYRRDLDRVNPVESRDRNLAFVSLNKKDNWFHYRVHSYSDYIDPQNDNSTEQFILGTIDHTLKRQWIDLTNWIKISVDGSYTEFESAHDQREHNRYAVNLFSTMRRPHFSMANFTNYSRVRKGGLTSQQLELPFYLSRHFNPDLDLRGQLRISYYEQQDFFDSIRDEKDNDYYGQVQLAVDKSRRIQIVPTLEAESRAGDRGHGRAVRTKLEVYSNQRLREELNWFGSASLAYFGDGNAEPGTSFLESVIAGRVGRQLNRQTHARLSQRFVLGYGELSRLGTRYVRPVSKTSLLGSGTLRDLQETTYFSSASELSLEHAARNGMKNRLTFKLEHERDAVDSMYRYLVEHDLRYRRRALQISMRSRYEFGDGVTSSSASLDESNGLGNFGIKHYFAHVTRLQYLPNKYWGTVSSAAYEWAGGSGSDEGDVTFIRFKQKATRNFYKINGIIRKLAKIEGELEYEMTSRGGNASNEVHYSLLGSYYPFRLLSLMSGFEYHDYSNRNGYWNARFNVNLTYPKLKVSFAYRYGASKGGDVVAHSYEVNVTKIF